MKRTYRFLLATLVAAATGLSAEAGNGRFLNNGSKDDTIIVKLANDAKMTLYLKNTNQLQSFQSYSLDSLMLMLGQYVEKVEQVSKQTNSKDMTVNFHPAKETNNPKAPEQVTVTLTDKSGGRRQANNVEVGKALKIEVEYDSAGQASKFSMTVPAKKDEPKASGGTEKKEDKKKDKPYKATTSDFDIDLGLNAFINKETVIDPGNGQEINYDLKPLGSRYIAFTFRRITQVGGEKSPLHLNYGISFAFNNYMFDKNVQILDVNDNSIFIRSTTPLDKSKLSATIVELPFTPSLEFKNKKGKDAFRIGAGGFAGYRLSSHTKIKYDVGDVTKKDKVKGNYNMEDFQYGLNFLVGYGSVTLFGKYHLNELFKDNRGPSVNVLGFGIRI